MRRVFLSTLRRINWIRWNSSAASSAQLGNLWPRMPLLSNPMWVGGKQSQNQLLYQRGPRLSKTLATCSRKLWTLPIIARRSKTWDKRRLLHRRCTVLGILLKRPRNHLTWAMASIWWNATQFDRNESKKRNKRLLTVLRFWKNRILKEAMQGLGWSMAILKVLLKRLIRPNKISSKARKSRCPFSCNQWSALQNFQKIATQKRRWVVLSCGRIHN